MALRSAGWRGACVLLAWAALNLSPLLEIPVSAAPVAKPAPAKKSLVQVSGPVTIPGDQGLQLFAQYFVGRPNGPGVVLLHMDGRSSDDWKHFAEKLGKAGFHTLALDLRGHGKSTRLSGGKTLTYDQLNQAEYQAMTKDVAAAVEFLRTRTGAEPAQIAIIGASIGANLAIRYAAEDARISNVILLSPGLDYKGVATEDAVQRYGARPLYIVVSREDNFSAKSSLVLESMARGKTYLQVYTGAGHGTKMMSREPALETNLLSWLNGTLQPDEGQDDFEPGPPRSTRTQP